MKPHPFRALQRRIPSRLLTAFLSVLAAAQAAAANGALNGKIADATTNMPLSGALVSLAGTNLETSANSAGEFALTDLPPGSYTARISFLGYEPRDYPITVIDGQPATLIAKLGGGAKGDVVELGAFVVQGQRGGQARALNEQRTSESLVNILASDDLGRFPDQNAAEALQRVVGVSLTRDEGEGQTVQVRGVEENLNSTSWNGVSLPGTRGGREALLDMIPSDLLDTLEVSKVFTPDMEGQGIGGRVNIKTLTAFSREGRIVRLSGEGQYSDASSRWGHRFSATYGDKFADDKWGFLASATYSDRSLHSTGLSVASWATKNNFLIPGGAVNFDQIDTRRVRDGLNTSLDFRPSAGNAFYVRGIFTRLRNSRLRLRDTFQNNAAATTPTTDRTGTVTARPMVINMQSLREDSRTWTVFAGGEHQWSSLKLDYMASFSRGEITPTTIPVPFTSANTSWSYDLNDYSRPVFTGPGLALQPSAYNAASYKWQHDFKHENEYTAEANLRRAMEIRQYHGYWKTGAKYRAKHKVNDQNQESWNVITPGSMTLADVAAYAPVAGSSFATIDPRDYSVSGKIDEFFRSNPTKFRLDAAASDQDRVLNDFIDDENVLAGYAMGGIDIGALGLVAGARVERSMFESQGWKTVGSNLATLERIRADKDYTAVLPSVVGKYRFTPRLLARFSWTGTQARPKFGNSNFNVTINENTGVWSMGNPNLKPYRAENWDASLEFYPKSLGVISAAIFYKDIKDFVTTQTIVGGAPDGADVRMPVNGKTAYVHGVELEWQQQFRMLPSPLDGLGLYANYTLTDSESTYANLATPRKEVFTNISKRMANLSLAYEKYGAFLRVSANYRSEYLTSVNVNPLNDQFVPSQWRLDASANYRVTKNITWFAEALNLLNTPQETHIRNTGALVSTSYYSWALNTGIKYKY